VTTGRGLKLDAANLRRPQKTISQFVINFQSRLFELTCVLVRLDHVASIIVNANHTLLAKP
jgi:hypothetical protein